jgi:hypothetical protein
MPFAPQVMMASYAGAIRTGGTVKEGVKESTVALPVNQVVSAVVSVWQSTTKSVSTPL